MLRSRSASLRQNARTPKRAVQRRSMLRSAMLRSTITIKVSSPPRGRSEWWMTYDCPHPRWRCAAFVPMPKSKRSAKHSSGRDGIVGERKVRAGHVMRAFCDGRSGEVLILRCAPSSPRLEGWPQVRSIAERNSADHSWFETAQAPPHHEV